MQAIRIAVVKAARKGGVTVGICRCTDLPNEGVVLPSEPTPEKGGTRNHAASIFN